MSCQTKAAKVEPLIKSLFSLSLVGNADCPCLRLCRPAEDFSRNKERLSPEKSVEDDIISGATQTVCKHFFMLIASNTRANVKLIYTTCQEKRSKPNYFSVMASLILGGAPASVSLTAGQQETTTGNLHLILSHFGLIAVTKVFAPRWKWDDQRVRVYLRGVPSS